MSRNENIDNAIWQDEPFADLTAPAKLTYVWSWTNQLCGMAGLYKVRQQQIELDTGQTKGVVSAALDELRERGLVYYVDGVLWVVARVKRLLSQTPQIARSIAKDVAGVTVDHPLRGAFLAWHWESKWPGEGLRERFGSEGQPTLTRGSLDGHATPDAIEKILRVARGSPDPLSVSAVVRAVAVEEEKPTVVARDDVAAIWEHYLDAFHPDRKGPLPELSTWRPIVVAALKVRPVEQCKLAITGLARSDWHQGGNAEGRRWTEIRYALHGNQNQRETDAQRIDRMAALATAPRTAPVAHRDAVEDKLARLRKEAQGADVIEGRAA